MKINTNKLMFAIILMMLPSFLFSYGWQTCEGKKITWKNDATTMYISTTSFPENSWWDRKFQNAMYRWNDVKGSNFRFLVNRDTDGSHNKKNGINEVYMANSSELANNGALAVTYRRWQCEYEYFFFGAVKTKYYEADIAFNPHYSWTDDNQITWIGYNKETSRKFSFEGVAVHELGHALGLNHSDSVLATMNSYYPNGGPVGHYNTWVAHGDDRNGVRYLYPDATTETDIVASKYQHTTAGSSSVITIPARAGRGNTISIKYTTENLSTDAKQYRVAFYLSTNDYISKYDTLLSDTTLINAPRGANGTHTKNLVIPSTLAVGRYYIGFIVDDHSAYSESSESNNFIALGSINIY